jgi:site-specific recombinase XerD
MDTSRLQKQEIAESIESNSAAGSETLKISDDWLDSIFSDKKQDAPPVSDKSKYAQVFAKNTIKQYECLCEKFYSWCDDRNIQSLPASDETVETFMIYLADSGKKFSTIIVYLSAISKWHKENGYRSPLASDSIKSLIVGIKREIGTAQVGVDPLLTTDLKKIVSNMSSDITGVRDKALFLVGWFGAFRRSELVNVLRTNISFTEEGMKITIPKSKTDQVGKGMVKAIPFQKNKDVCPVLAAKDWLILSPKSRFFLCHTGFAPGNKTKPGDKLSDKMVYRLVRKYAEESEIAGRFGGHSFRSGFATSAVRAGKSDRDIMRTTGHRSRNSLDKYVRVANEFDRNAGDNLMD